MSTNAHARVRICPPKMCYFGDMKFIAALLAVHICFQVFRMLQDEAFTMCC